MSNKALPTLTLAGVVKNPEHVLDFLLIDYYTADSNQLSNVEVATFQNTLRKAGNEPSRCCSMLEEDIRNFLMIYFDNVSVMVTSNDAVDVSRVDYTCNVTIITERGRFEQERVFFDEKSRFRKLTNELNSGEAYA